MFFSMICNREPPGFRDAGNNNGYGTLLCVGHYGFSWSSAIPTGSGGAHSLNFNFGGIGPQGSYGRAYGFPLRCLQE